MRIAICDDEQQDLENIVRLVGAYAPLDVHISSFSSSACLLREANQSIFDLVLLDIEMPSPNGYETALQLKQLSTPPLLLFLTNSMEYTLRGYGLVFRYLKKPIIENELYPALDAAFREINANRFQFSVGKDTHILSMDDIYYLEIFNHHIELHTIDESFTFRASLKDILPQLPQGFFGMPHQSCILNFSHIRTAQPSQVILTNGVCIAVSRRRQREFMEQFHQYLGR